MGGSSLGKDMARVISMCAIPMGGEGKKRREKLVKNEGEVYVGGILSIP